LGAGRSDLSDWADWSDRSDEEMTMQHRTRTQCLLVLGAAAAFAAGMAQAQVMMPTEAPKMDGHQSLIHAWINNVTVIPRDDATAVIQFDLAWHGSWRTEVNHDAVWIFFKFRTESDPEKGGWRHVCLKADKVLNPTGYGQAPAGAKLTLSRGKGSSAWTADGDTKFDFLVPVDLVPAGEGKTNEFRAGTFVRRADHGMGTASGGKLTVLWDLTKCPDVKRDTKVQLLAHDVIMMYVAEGPYSLGSGGSETYSFYQFQSEKKRGAEQERITVGGATMVVHEEIDSSNDCPPYRVASSNAIPTGAKPGKLWARGAEPPDGGEIPASFPNGYRAFYAKAYPLGKAAYAHMLELLTPEEADERYQIEGFPVHGGISRTLIGEGPACHFLGGGGRKSRALFYLCWADCASYANWAGLRPMTELEYEKTLRGPRAPVPEECGSSFWGGSFGGSRYNAHPREFSVTVGAPEGLQFMGTHGTGTSTNWPSDWPKKDAKGTGVRGGQEAASGPAELKAPFWCTSCRIDAALADAERYITYGFRPARTAPEEAKWNSARNEQESSPLLQGLPEYGR
jgi:hypothetical protein